MKKTFNYIFFLLLAIVSVLFVNRIILLFSFNLDLGGLENYFTFLSLKVGSDALYTHPEQYPFMVTQYPPLYLYLTHYLAELIDVFFKDMVRSVYVAGRFINIICNIITVVLVYKFFKNQLNISLKKAAIPALILFTLFIEHAYAVRMDSLKMLFIVSMYIQGYKYYKKPSNHDLLLLILIGFLAMIAKQDSAIHVGVLGLAFFAKGKFLNAFKFGIPIAVLFFLFSFITCGFSWEIFYLNYVVGISQGVDFPWAKMVFGWNPFAMIAQLILILTALIWSFSNQRKQFWMPFLLSLLYLFASFNILKWGSNFNYYFEFQILIVCLFSYWIYQHYSKFLASILYGCMAVFLFNNIWNKNLGLINIADEKGYIEQYKEYKEHAIGLKHLLQTDGASEVIVFSQSLSLMLYDKVVLGTTANEYPEWQFPSVETLPRRTYDYHFDCSDSKLEQIRFITWDKVDEFHKDLLYEMLDTNDGLTLTRTRKYSIYNFYKITCSN